MYAHAKTNTDFDSSLRFLHSLKKKKNLQPFSRNFFPPPALSWLSKYKRHKTVAQSVCMCVCMCVLGRLYLKENTEVWYQK